MIYRTFLIIIFCLVTIGCQVPNNNIEILGKWESIDKSIEITFNKDNTCILKVFDKNQKQVELINGNFRLDFSKKPVPLSITNVRELDFSIYTIVTFTSENSMEMAHFSNKSKLRPIIFEKGKTISLNREIVKK